MADFSTEAEIQLTVPERELRQVRQQIQDGIGETPVGMTDGGAPSAQAGEGGGRERRRARRSFRMEIERTDHLEDIVEILHGFEESDGAGAGGLLGDAIGGVGGAAGGLAGAVPGAIGAAVGSAAGPLIGDAISDTVGNEELSVDDPSPLSVEDTTVGVDLPEDDLGVDHPEEPYALDHPEEPYAVDHPEEPYAIEDVDPLAVEDPGTIGVDDGGLDPLSVEDVDPLEVAEVDPITVERPDWIPITVEQPTATEPTAPTPDPDEPVEDQERGGHLVNVELGPEGVALQGPTFERDDRRLEIAGLELGDRAADNGAGIAGGLFRETPIETAADDGRGATATGQSAARPVTVTNEVTVDSQVVVDNLRDMRREVVQQLERAIDQAVDDLEREVDELDRRIEQIERGL